MTARRLALLIAVLLIALPASAAVAQEDASHLAGCARCGRAATGPDPAFGSAPSADPHGPHPWSARRADLARTGQVNGRVEGQPLGRHVGVEDPRSGCDQSPFAVPLGSPAKAASTFCRRRDGHLSCVAHH